MYCRVVLEVDQANGPIYLLDPDSPTHKPIEAVYICTSVLSCHLKTNKLLDTSLRLLYYLTSTKVCLFDKHDFWGFWSIKNSLVAKLSN